MLAFFRSPVGLLYLVYRENTINKRMDIVDLYSMV
jgi:hypothetical protein